MLIFAKFAVELLALCQENTSWAGGNTEIFMPI